MKKKIVRQEPIYQRIRSIIEKARGQVWHTVNTEMVHAYWLIGKEIVEEEQKGKKRAEYGEALINDLSSRLGAEFGKGFTAANIWNMRQFYLTYPKLYAVRRESAHIACRIGTGQISACIAKTVKNAFDIGNRGLYNV